MVPRSALPLINDPSLIVIPLKHKSLYTSITFITRKEEEMPPIINHFINSFKEDKTL